MVAPSAMGYLAVSRVGVGFVTLTFACPVLITWLIARLLRMPGANKRQVGGVIAGLAGGVLLALGKLAEGGGPNGGTFWVLVASAIPLALALGNIYRTRYWPKGAQALPLAAMSVLLGAAAIMPVAALSDAARWPVLWQDPQIVALSIAGAFVVALQYRLQFLLQALAGPVYMSQIGSVAAVSGAFIAVLAMGEALPPFFWPAAGLIVFGTVIFHRARTA